MIINIGCKFNYYPPMSLVAPPGLPATRTDVTMRDLIRGHQAVVMDAYGVTRARTGEFPWAERTLREILRQDKLMIVASNDASNFPEDIQQQWQAKGVSIEYDLIFTSGQQLELYVQENDLNGADAVILGNEKNRAFAEAAGLKPLPQKGAMARYQEVKLVVISENYGFSQETLDAAGSAVYANNAPIVITTPDKVVPYFHDREPRGFSLGVMFTALGLMGLTGAEATIIGKPAQGMFNRIKSALAKRGLEPKDVIFFDDNLYEGGVGALTAGFPFALVTGTGISGAIARGEMTGPFAELDQKLLSLGFHPTFEISSTAIEESHFQRERRKIINFPRSTKPSSPGTINPNPFIQPEVVSYKILYREAA